jgi:putative transposase
MSPERILLGSCQTPTISGSIPRALCLGLWRGNWANILPFFQFLPEIRKVIYTTNAIESLNMVMRKYTRNRRIFPNDASALKSLLLAIRDASKNWKSIHHWKPALQSFQLMFGEERVPLAAL